MSDAPEQFSSRRERRHYEQELAARLEAEAAAAAGAPLPVAAPSFEPAAALFVSPVEEPVVVPVTPIAPPAFEDTSAAAAMFGSPTVEPELAPVLPPAAEPALDDAAADAFFSKASAFSAPAPTQPASAPAADAPAWEPTAEPIVPTVAADPMPIVGGGAPKRPEPKPPAPPADKGVNLWAAISITATLASAVLTYLPPTAFIAPFIAFAAVPLAAIAIFLPGFKKIQSIVALVIALGFGGYNAYTMFIAPPAEDNASEVAPTLTGIDVDVEGAGEASVTWLLEEESGSTIEESNDAAALPFSLALPVSDLDLASLTVTVTSSDGSPVSCALSVNGQALIETVAPEAGTPAVCTYRGSGLDEVPASDEPQETPASTEPTPAP